INIYSSLKAPVVAVNDGVIKKIGQSPRLGKYIVLEDAYGNSFTYAELGSIEPSHPVPRSPRLSPNDFRLEPPGKDSAPAAPATPAAPAPARGSRKRPAAPADSENSRRRLFALPERAGNARNPGIGGQLDRLLGRSVPGYETFKSALSSQLRFDSQTMVMKPL